MCGILASVGKYRFDRIPDALLDRGVDDYGIYSDEHVQLIQTRLQITGKQKINLPLQFDKYVLLFNGEIYNYKELNKELDDFEFSYDSDFETVLFSFIKWGNNFVEKLDGQYAIFIWDKEKQKEYFFTDKFKIKSIYKQNYKDSYIYSSNISSMPLISFNKTHCEGYGNVTNTEIL